MSQLPFEQAEQLVKGDHWDPLSILGLHPASTSGFDGFTIRCFLPDAQDVAVLIDTQTQPATPMKRIHDAGLFEAVCPCTADTLSYRLRITNYWGQVRELHDPYAFAPLLTDFELHLFAEGTFYKAYATMGTHLRVVQGVPGVHFVVWAPNARRVSVVGDFNQWDGRCHPMTNRGATGLWELFIPDLPEHTLYKYEIRSRSQDTPLLKSDPYAFAAELRPRTASIVHDLSRYQWNDRPWMEARAQRNPLTRPMSIYEVHLGSWMRVPEEQNRWLTYRELASKLIPYAKDMGYTHLELMPVTEHPFDASWGYQATGYFAATSRYGSPEEFMAFDGTHLYDHADPRLGYHPDWRSRIFNYDRTEVRNFLLNTALFWLDTYHIDGLRVDAVASMLY